MIAVLQCSPLPSSLWLSVPTAQEPLLWHVPSSHCPEESQLQCLCYQLSKGQNQTWLFRKGSLGNTLSPRTAPVLSRKAKRLKTNY